MRVAYLVSGAVLIAGIGAWTGPARATDWLPFSPDELSMKEEPKAPSAPAIYLYRQVDRYDTTPDETNYLRIKILTEEGRRYANVEIPYDKGTESIDHVVARTIHPDGTIVNFDGTVYDKPIVETTGQKLLAKTFTLPDVQVGSIVEYRYRRDLEFGYVFNSQWVLSADLFTKHAKFSLTPYQGFPMTYSWPIGLPLGTPVPTKAMDVIRLETSDIPAFVKEEFMPPPNELTYRVVFTYWSDFQPERKPEDFWKKYGKKKYSDLERFLDEPKAMKEAVAGIVDPSDPPEAKLRKLYARAQQVRNITFEAEKTQQEADRENLKSIKNVEQVWHRGYGNGEQITWLFVALARAAGFQADGLLIPTRDQHFFNQKVMNPADLNTNAAVVTLNGTEIYLDPGAALAPFGTLPWQETAVVSLRLDKDGGKWITVPIPEMDDSQIDRKAVLELTPQGTLQGTVTVTYSGQEALWRRWEERHEDSTDRKQFLEDQLRSDIPSGSDVELTNQPAWAEAAPTLVAEYRLTVPGWASTAGQRALMPAGLFGNAQKHVFEHATRLHALYFDYPYRIADDVTLKLPATWQVGSLPQLRKTDLGGMVYSATAEAKDGAVHLKRDIAMNALLLKKSDYPSVQGFFGSIRTGDDDQLVLLRQAKAAKP